METTHTMAGQLADAGAARLAWLPRCVVPHRCAMPYGAPAQHQVRHHRPPPGPRALLPIRPPVMVLDRKNRPTRPLSELSP